MLDPSLKQQLQSHLQRMSHPVELVAHVDDTDASRELRSLLGGVASLSSMIRLQTRETTGSDSQVRTPSFSVARAGSAPRIRYAGLPMGHEFTSFVLSLLQAGGHPPRMPDSVARRVQALEGDFEFEVYVSLSCQNCPEVVQALNAMAALNPRIRSTMIDGALFGAEIDARRVMAVPAVYLNGQPFGHGRMTAEEILAKLDAGNPAQRAAALDAKEPFDVLVIGGGPAGAAAAIYAARKGIRTGLVAERFGGQLMDTMGVENFISVTATEGPKLAAALEEHVRSYEVDVLNLQRATALHPAGESGLATVELASGARLRSRAVILATGARWREMNVPGEREHRGHGVAYCPHCDGPLFKGKRVAVIGGGNSGVEAAIDLAGIVAHVTLIEFDGRLRADEVLQRKLRSMPNVRVLVAAETTEVHGADGRVTGLSYRDRGNGAHHRLDLEGVFVQVGLVPNTDWLQGTVALNSRGEIETDARGGTSAPGVFAAGDATTVSYKQIIVAMGEGSKAALGAFDHLLRLPIAASASLAA